MNQIKIFKTILYVIFILGIAGLLITPIVLALSNNITIQGETVTSWNLEMGLRAARSIIIFILFLIGVYKLKLAVDDFYVNESFNEFISKSFKQLGVLVIAATLFYIISGALIELIFKQNINFKINAMYLIHAGIAYFFFMLSVMIEKAQGFQEENKLTV